MSNFTRTITLTNSGPIVTKNLEPADTLIVTVEDLSSSSQNANNITLSLTGSNVSINKSAVTSTGETFVVTPSSSATQGVYNWSVGLSGSVKGQGNVSGTVNGILTVDQIPHAYSFTNVTNSSVNTQHTEKAQITGINKAAYVGPAPSGFELAVYTSGTPPSNFWRTTATNITNGQYLHVRGNAPSSVGQTKSGVFSVGTGAGGTLTSASWSISTVSGDSTPDGFSFPNLTNAALNYTFTRSAEITGINTTVTVSRGGDSSASFAVSSSSTTPANSAFTVADKTLTNNQYVHFRMASSLAYSTSKTANISVGTVTSPNWTITTRAPDATPTAFTFTNISGVARNASQNAYVQITGIEVGVTATISGGSATFAVSSSTTTPADSAFSAGGKTVANNQYVHVRLTSSNNYNTTVTTTLTAGGVSDGWDVTTQAAPGTVDGFVASQGGTPGSNSHGLSIKSSNGTEMFGVNLRNTAIQVFSTFSIGAGSSQTFACNNANDSTKILIITKGINIGSSQSTTATLSTTSTNFTITNNASVTITGSVYALGVG